MLKELDIRSEGITYVGHFARPLFDLWGKGEQIVRPLYEALSPYGVTLGNIVVHSIVAHSAEPVITVWVRGSSTVKFAFDRIEFAINGLSEEYLEALPELFRASTAWIKREAQTFKFASHSFGYNCHAIVNNSTVKDTLDSINPKRLECGGSSLGSGSIFHNSVPEKNWKTRIVFDHSLLIPGALFVGLVIDTQTEEPDYQTMLVDARSYLRSVLAEASLALPELSS